MSVFKIIDVNFAKIGIWKLNETVDELKVMIFNDLSQQEKLSFANFKSNRRQKEWLATRALLKKLRNTKKVEEIKYLPTCKPYLDTENIGISHSHDFVAIILSENAEVSIDIEKISHKPQRISHKFLSTDELNFFDISDDKIATLLWSAKETVYKFHSQKELAFIGKIKLHKTKINAKGTLNATLNEEKNLLVNYEFIENNILTYIVGEQSFNFKTYFIDNK